MAGSDLLNKMLESGGFSNAENIEKKRQELAAAVTRVVINEAMAEMRARKAEIERMSIKTDKPDTGAKTD
jgi:folate-dependent phosphoribosylglycinamide formyltransferase PurN